MRDHISRRRFLFSTAITFTAVSILGELKRPVNQRETEAQLTPHAAAIRVLSPRNSRCCISFRSSLEIAMNLLFLRCC